MSKRVSQGLSADLRSSTIFSGISHNVSPKIGHFLILFLEKAGFCLLTLKIEDATEIFLNPHTLTSSPDYGTTFSQLISGRILLNLMKEQTLKIHMHEIL